MRRVKMFAILLAVSGVCYAYTHGSNTGQFAFWLGTGTIMTNNNNNTIIVDIHHDLHFVKYYSISTPETRFWLPLSAKASYTLPPGFGCDVFANLQYGFSSSWSIESGIGAFYKFPIRKGDVIVFDTDFRIGGSYLWAKNHLARATDRNITFATSNGGFGGFGEVGFVFNSMPAIRIALGYKLFEKIESPSIDGENLGSGYTVTQLPAEWGINPSGPYISLEVKLLPTRKPGTCIPIADTREKKRED